MDRPPPSRPTSPRPIATYALMAACLAGYAASTLFSGDLDTFSLVCCGAKERLAIRYGGEWWRLISSGFLHGGLVHLLMNVYGLFALGAAIERLWGTRRFLLIYTAGLIGGSVASLFLTPAVSVGASGAIFALFGAVAVFAIRHGSWMRPGARSGLLRQLVVIGGINIWLGVTIPFIDNAAHGGGFVAGVLAALLLRPVMLQRGTGMLLRLGAAACVVAMGVSIVAAAEFALSSDWIMLARTQLEPRTIGDGPFELSVPRGWTYEKPKAKSRIHVFQNPGTARFAVQILRTEDSAGPQAMLDQLVQSETQQGGELLFTTEGQLDEWRSYEAHVLYTRDSGNVRVRLMVLESASGHEVLVVCSCAERYYDLMHVIFDKMAQSIHLWPERPRHIDALSFWQRITRDSGDVEAAVSLARFYRSEGTPRPAEQMLLLALGVRKGYAPAHDELAYLYATASGEFRRPDEAVRHARQAVSLEPQNARYQATLAVALEAAGDLDAALTAAQTAVKLAPDDARYVDLVARLTSTARRRR